MKNNYDEEDDYDYWPNELAELSLNNPAKYRQIVNSNLEPGDTVDKWENKNLEWSKDCLAQQKN